MEVSGGKFNKGVQDFVYNSEQRPTYSDNGPHKVITFPPKVMIFPRKVTIHPQLPKISPKYIFTQNIFIYVHCHQLSQVAFMHFLLVKSTIVPKV